MLSWIFLLVGGACEVGFVIFMKLSDGFRTLKYSLLTILFQIFSFYSLSHALKEIQIGIGYAVWAGIGAVGSVLVGMILFKESKDLKKVLFISMIIIGIIGLKLAS
ncbi:multidrug efflux SMR transporter [Dysgonomonas sp. Marseille-P4677]|uniref:DMT family transporter n=1 Tax=Dysgonomonas sp. Marseille-P4677 TaxID=2364790 RepID=UPI00191314FC|nr:multidrug efflux SMR transporter [Dysgonomonas sp. Marseille-P4677]MBK5721256.1 multidrug efflux SMR transporter [Dysgonomonas sp. Marseille-P4677]